MKRRTFLGLLLSLPLWRWLGRRPVKAGPPPAPRGLTLPYALPHAVGEDAPTDVDVVEVEGRGCLWGVLFGRRGTTTNGERNE